MIDFFRKIFLKIKSMIIIDITQFFLNITIIISRRNLDKIVKGNALVVSNISDGKIVVVTYNQTKYKQ